MEAPPDDASVSVLELLQLLAHPDENVNLFAVCRLVSMGPQGLPAVPSLVNLLESQSLVEVKLAAWSLESMGPEAKEAIPGLLKALSHSDASVRKFATAAIHKIDPETLHEHAA